MKGGKGGEVEPTSNKAENAIPVVLLRNQRSIGTCINKAL